MISLLLLTRQWLGNLWPQFWFNFIIGCYKRVRIFYSSVSGRRWCSKNHTDDEDNRNSSQRPIVVGQLQLSCCRKQRHCQDFKGGEGESGGKQKFLERKLCVCIIPVNCVPLNRGKLEGKWVKRLWLREMPPYLPLCRTPGDKNIFVFSILAWWIK